MIEFTHFSISHTSGNTLYYIKRNPGIWLLIVLQTAAVVGIFSSVKSGWKQESTLIVLEQPVIHSLIIQSRLKTQRIEDLQTIKNALEAYYQDHQSYPVTGWAGVLCSFGLSRSDWIPGLVPDYLPQLPTAPRYSTTADEHYLYVSDGKNYKLIVGLVQPDMTYIYSHFPDMVDPMRDPYAYGFWNPGASQW